MLGQGWLPKLIKYGGTTAVHTFSHRGIGGRPSVGSGGGPDLHRGASAGFSDGRADHGRYRFACRSRSRADRQEARTTGAEAAAFRLLRSFFEIRGFKVT